MFVCAIHRELRQIEKPFRGVFKTTMAQFRMFRFKLFSIGRAVGRIHIPQNPEVHQKTKNNYSGGSGGTKTASLEAHGFSGVHNFR